MVRRLDDDVPPVHLPAGHLPDSLSPASNVECTFSMIKTKFGDSLGSQSLTGQFNEVLAKVVAHNLCVLIACIHEIGLVSVATSGPFNWPTVGLGGHGQLGVALFVIAALMAYKRHRNPTRVRSPSLTGERSNLVGDPVPHR